VAEAFDCGLQVVRVGDWGIAGMLSGQDGPSRRAIVSGGLEAGRLAVKDSSLIWAESLRTATNTVIYNPEARITRIMWWCRRLAKKSRINIMI